MKQENSPNFALFFFFLISLFLCQFLAVCRPGSHLEVPEGSTVLGPPGTVSGGLGGLCSLLLQQGCFPIGGGKPGFQHPFHPPRAWWGSWAGCRSPSPSSSARGCNPDSTRCAWSCGSSLVPLCLPLPWGSHAVWLYAGAAGGQIRGDRRKMNSLKCDGGECLVLSAIAPPTPSLSPAVFLSLWG